MDVPGGPAAANNSSDFVRKLYKMLEDPSYSTVVRWGDEGDSFVVLENEKFTKSILPKHFKHSNFASFVRQLNKYDFHKVRQNNEEGGTSPYGPNAWEFKHPEFKANNKDALDNIRRKAPAPRKPSSMNEEVPIHQMDLMNQQLGAQAQQIEQLMGRYSDVMMSQQVMHQEINRVRKAVSNYEGIISNVMTFLHSVDAKQRRDSKILFNTDAGTAQLTPTSQNVNISDDEPASPLQTASKLLNDLASDAHYNVGSMDQMHDASKTVAMTPPADQTFRMRAPQSAESSSSMGFARLNNGELDQVVYPMGTSQGIDPMYSEHVNNIPYSIPPKEIDTDPRRVLADTRKKSSFADPGWTRSPRVLLVEDDPTCRNIGGKFLFSFNCTIDSALDGLEAVSKIQEGSRYDMILMDIIMPNLDGVSACHLIRQYDRTPIIAMTSNIRNDDIQMYFQHGMDDVLPKPFTRKSLLDMLEKHLSHLKKVPTGMEPPPSASSIPHSSAHSLKDDVSSPAQSPATSLTWHSPGTFPGVSPIHTGLASQYASLGPPSSFSTSPQTPLSAGRPMAQPPPFGPHRRQASEMAGGPDINAFNKRARLYGQPQQNMGMPGPQ